jgi:hypothetical protein
VGEITANVLTVGALPCLPPAIIPLSKDGHLLQSDRIDGSLLYASAYLSLLLCCDANLCSLIVVGFHLLQMWWPSRCRGLSLPGRGSWIVGKVSLPRERMDWKPLSMPLERCALNVMPVASEPRLSSRTSLPKRASIALGLDSSPTSTGHWRNARSFFACRR